jgi:dynactin-4
MLVSYTYRSDDPAPSDGGEGDIEPRSPTAPKAAPEMKTFSFFTVVDLGVIVPKDETKVE